MNFEQIEKQLTEVIANAEQPATFDGFNKIRQSTITLMIAMYGKGSSQETILRSTLDDVRGDDRPTIPRVYQEATKALRGSLASMLQEIEAGFVGSVKESARAEILADFIRLAKEAARETEGKDVAAVLAAAAFEDTLRKIAERNGIPHHEKLQECLNELNRKNILEGAQLSLANSYLSFRNRALHAKWSEVDLPSVQSAIAFTEGLLIAHFQ